MLSCISKTDFPLILKGRIRKYNFFFHHIKHNGTFSKQKEDGIITAVFNNRMIAAQRSRIAINFAVQEHRPDVALSLSRC